MSKLPRVVVSDLIPEPLECERRVLNGHADVIALDFKNHRSIFGGEDQAAAPAVTGRQVI